MINWKVRVKNKLFWLTLIPLLFALVAELLEMVGIHFEYGTLEEQILEIVKRVFEILGVLGIIVDPTTKGIADSELAMTYEAPKER